LRWAFIFILGLLGAVAISGCSGYDSADRAATDNAAPAETGGYVDTGGYVSPPTYSYDDDEYAPYADAQDAWDNQDGPDWEAFSDAYIAGWEEGCDIAFEDSPDGSLHDQDKEFTADDCYANEPYDASESDVPYEAPDDPEYEGEQLGMQDGCESAFEDLPSDGGGALYYGDEEFDDSVCPVA
jgi:hypothetical protein